MSSKVATGEGTCEQEHHHEEVSGTQNFMEAGSTGEVKKHHKQQ